VTLIEYSAPQASYTISGVEPGLSEYAVEVWERITDGGINGTNSVPYSEWYWNVGRGVYYASMIEAFDAAR
jgi:hypothetical protein